MDGRVVRLHHFRTRGDPATGACDADRVCLFCMLAGDYASAPRMSEHRPRQMDSGVEAREAVQQLCASEAGWLFTRTRQQRAKLTSLV